MDWTETVVEMVYASVCRLEDVWHVYIHPIQNL